MVKIRQLAVGGAAVVSVLGLTASPASAATSITGPGWDNSGVQARLLGLASVGSSIGSGTCNQSTMTGTINPNGTNLSITAANFNTNGGPCSGSLTSTITAQNLPWTGGNLTFTAPPGPGGRNGTITIANFRVRAVINFLGTITCNYGGNLTANFFNPTNASRPVLTNNRAQAQVNGAVVNKISSGSHLLCPNTANVTAVYELLGRASAGGAYNVTLTAGP